MKAEIKIEGMHCASCQNNLTKALNRIKGVFSANVNLMNRKAVIEFNEKKVDEEKIKKAISSVGNYRVVRFNVEGETDNHENMDEHSGHSMSGSAEDKEISSWKKKNPHLHLR
jgi:copper chaperone CopZ